MTADLSRTVSGATTRATGELRIRRGVATDAGMLAEFAAQCFTQTFAADNRPEDLYTFLQSAYGEPQQRRELGDPDWITLLACQADALVGYAQVARSSPPACVPRGAVELVRFYLETGAHGRGVAQKLMAKAFAAGRELDATRIWLGVWERNPRAIAFYRKCGFIDVGSKDFLVGRDLQRDRVMLAPIPILGIQPVFI